MIFNPGSWVTLRFTGPDRKKFLHGLVTADVLSLQPGGYAYSLILTPKGRLRGDFDLYDRGEDLLALASPQAGANMINDISKPIILSETKLEPLSGPVWYSTEDRPGALRSHIGPQGGWLLSPPDEQTLPPERFGAYLTEQGVPLYGRDMDEQTLAQEARLDAALSFTKGCYMGQETVSRVHHMGHVNRLLCRLRLSGEGSPPAGANLFAGEDETGRLTSVSGSAALGWVKTVHAAAGARLNVRCDDSRWTAEVL